MPGSKIILAIIAACGVNPNTESQEAPAAMVSPGDDHENPDSKVKPKPDIQVGHIFCCQSVSSAGSGSGEGCTLIAEPLVNTCSNVLHCPEGWTSSNTNVTCDDDDDTDTCDP